MEGWIKLHRKIIDNPYYFSEPFTRSQSWIDLLLIANHATGYFYKRGIKVEVHRGQVGYDIETLAHRWKWSRGKVERFLNGLENDSQIVRQKTNVTTLISICNYDTYQTDGKANGKAGSKANGQQTTNQTVKQTDTNKNDDNVNNDENVNNVDFLLFWNEYPKKVAKKQCEQIWDELPEHDKSEIIRTLPRFIKSKQFDAYKHPYPENYLSKRRWEDEIKIDENSKTVITNF